MFHLQSGQEVIAREVQQLKERIDYFETSRPFVKFGYTDPEPNFNRNHVRGLVCKLIKIRNEEQFTAIETAAGAKLYNVVVDNEVTSKKLLQKGNLRVRTTFIPMNKIRGGKVDQNTVKFAQKLIGRENVDLALNLLDYDDQFQTVMEYVFGHVFVCRTLTEARQVAFHEKIKCKCVTLEGDIVDPAGVLSGGAIKKETPVLLQIRQIMEYEVSSIVSTKNIFIFESSVVSLIHINPGIDGLLKFSFHFKIL